MSKANVEQVVRRLFPSATICNFEGEADVMTISHGGQKYAFRMKKFESAYRTCTVESYFKEDEVTEGDIDRMVIREVVTSFVHEITRQDA